MFFNLVFTPSILGTSILAISTARSAADFETKNFVWKQI